MEQTTDMAALADEYSHAAMELAMHTDIIDRINTDPLYSADRSERAKQLRERDRTECLERFRAAKRAYLGF